MDRIGRQQAKIIMPNPNANGDNKELAKRFRRLLNSAAERGCYYPESQRCCLG